MPTRRGSELPAKDHVGASQHNSDRCNVGLPLFLSKLVFHLGTSPVPFIRSAPDTFC